MIKLASETIDKKDLLTLTKWLKSNPRLTQGKQTLKFEKNFAKWIGSKYALFCNSGSSANLLMLSALLELNIIKKKSRVVVPSICWSTDVSPIFQLDLDPILCDINLENFSIDLLHLEKIYQKQKPKLLFLVSILGFASNIDEIVKLSKKYKVKIIEDNCESVGSLYKGKKLGNFGLMSSFSTFYGHHFSTIEGGLITTNNKELISILRMLRSHGWDRDLNKNEKIKLRKKWNVDLFNSLYTFYYSGFNLRSTNLQAFIGINQLRKLNKFCRSRNNNFRYYQKMIKNDYWKIKPINNLFVSNFGYPILSPFREKIIKSLKKNNVEVRPIISGSMGNQPFYIKKKRKTYIKNASIIDKYGFYLPNHHLITKKNINFICKIVNKFTSIK